MQRILLSILIVVSFFVSGKSQYLSGFQGYQAEPYLLGPSAMAYTDSTTLSVFLKHPMQNLDGHAHRTYSIIARTRQAEYFWGGMLFLDHWGRTSTVQSQLSFAQLFKINEEHAFSLGLTAAARQFRFDEIDYLYFEANDPVISNITEKNFSFDVDAGVSYISRPLRITATIINLLRSKVKIGHEQAYGFYPDREIYLTGLFRLPLGEQLTFYPSLSLRHVGKKINIFDTQFLLSYKEAYTAGLTVHLPLSFGLYAKLRYKNLLFSMHFSLFAKNLLYPYPLRMETGLMYFLPETAINR